MSDPNLSRTVVTTSFCEIDLPSWVAAVVAFLVHESCPVTGEIFVTGRARVSRLFMGQTAGYTNSHLTPEDVRDHLDAICDDSGYSVPPGTIRHGIDFDAEIDTAIGR